MEGPRNGTRSEEKFQKNVYLCNLGNHATTKSVFGWLTITSKTKINVFFSFFEFHAIKKLLAFEVLAHFTGKGNTYIKIYDLPIMA